MAFGVAYFLVYALALFLLCLVYTAICESFLFTLNGLLQIHNIWHETIDANYEPLFLRVNGAPLLLVKCTVFFLCLRKLNLNFDVNEYDCASSGFFSSVLCLLDQNWCITNICLLHLSFFLIGGKARAKSLLLLSLLVLESYYRLCCDVFCYNKLKVVCLQF